MSRISFGLWGSSVSGLEFIQGDILQSGLPPVRAYGALARN